MARTATKADIGHEALYEAKVDHPLAAWAREELVAAAQVLHPSARKVSEARIVLEGDSDEFRLGSVTLFAIDDEGEGEGLVAIAGTAPFSNTSGTARWALEKHAGGPDNRGKRLVLVLRDLEGPEGTRVRGDSWAGAAVACLRRHPNRNPRAGRSLPIYLGCFDPSGLVVAPVSALRDKLVAVRTVTRKMHCPPRTFIQAVPAEFESLVATGSRFLNRAISFMEFNDPDLPDWSPVERIPAESGRRARKGFTPRSTARLTSLLSAAAAALLLVIRVAASPSTWLTARGMVTALAAFLLSLVPPGATVDPPVANPTEQQTELPGTEQAVICYCEPGPTYPEPQASTETECSETLPAGDPAPDPTRGTPPTLPKAEHPENPTTPAIPPSCP